MKKITLSIALFLMSPVAFGQVNWGEYVDGMPSNSKQLVEDVAMNNRTLCMAVDREIEYNVTGVDSKGVVREDSFRVVLSSEVSSLIITLTLQDPYHWDGYFVSDVICELKDL